MLHKTLDDAIKTAREVVKEAGEDFVYTDNYETCYYSINGEPACLVGRVLAKWGVLPENVDSTFEDKYVATGRRVGMFAHELLRDMQKTGELSTDAEAKDFLTEIQCEQDNSATWGRALEAALEAVDF